MGRVRSAIIAECTALACAALLFLLLLGPAVARGALTIESFSAGTFANGGSPAHQAGATPFTFEASFSLGKSGDPEALENAVIGAPAGLFLLPTAVPRCGGATFAAFACPASTQVGLVTVRAEHEGDPSHLLGTAPVYALIPDADQSARLGFVAPTIDVPVTVPVTLRATDQGWTWPFRTFLSRRR